MPQLCISVLIRTFNSEKTLGDVLSRLDLDDDDECIIVDSGSTDLTLDIAARHGAHVVKLNPPFNYSRSLNAGFETARCDLVLVLSSHCIPLRNDLIFRMREVATHSTADVALIYGSVSLFDPGPLAPQVVTGNEADWQTERMLKGGNGFAMYPRQFWEMRKFNESLRTAEDLEWLKWALSNGYRASVVIDAVALYRNQGGLAYMYHKGFHETRHALTFQRPGSPGVSLLLSGRSFLLNFLSLTKMVVRHRLAVRDYLRLLAHGLGSAYATSFPSEKSIERL